MSGPVLHRCAVPTVAGVPTRMAVAELAITASMKARAYSIFSPFNLAKPARGLGVVRLESRKVPSERRENLDTASGSINWTMHPGAQPGCGRTRPQDPPSGSPAPTHDPPQTPPSGC